MRSGATSKQRTTSYRESPIVVSGPFMRKELATLRASLGGLAAARGSRCGLRAVHVYQERPAILYWTLSAPRKSLMNEASLSQRGFSLTTCCQAGLLAFQAANASRGFSASLNASSCAAVHMPR